MKINEELRQTSSAMKALQRARSNKRIWKRNVSSNLTQYSKA